MSEQEATLDEFVDDQEDKKESEVEDALDPKILTGVYDGWKKTPLADVADDQEDSFVDGPFGANLLSEEFHENGFARIIKLQNIRSGEFIDTNKKYIKKEKFDELERHAAYPGDISIAKMAEPVARACILPDFERQYILAAADCVKLDSDDDFNNWFVMYTMNSYPVWKQAFSRARGTGRKRINLNQLKEVQIPTPPNQEQQKIAGVLYNIDQAIQQTEKILDQAKRVRNGLLQDLLERGIDEENTLRSPASEAPDLFEEKRGRIIPSGWEIKNLADIGEWESGKTPRRSESSYWGGTIPWITAKDMKTLRVDETEDGITEVAVEEGAPVVPADNSVLVLVRGMILDHTLPVVRPTKDASFNQDVKAILPQEDVNPDYLAYWLESHSEEVLGLVTEASHGTKRLSTESFGKISVPIPPLNEQAAIVECAELFDRKITKEKSYVEQLKRLKHGLMQDLLSGEVRTHDKDIELVDNVLQHG